MYGAFITQPLRGGASSRLPQFPNRFSSSYGNQRTSHVIWIHYLNNVKLFSFLPWSSVQLLWWLAIAVNYIPTFWLRVLLLSFPSLQVNVFNPFSILIYSKLLERTCALFNIFSIVHRTLVPIFHFHSQISFIFLFLGIQDCCHFYDNHGIIRYAYILWDIIVSVYAGNQIP